MSEDELWEELGRKRLMTETRPLLICNEEGGDRQHRTRASVDGVSRAALRTGRGILAVAVDPEAELPALICAASDLELRLPPPTPDMLRAVAAAVASGDAPPLASDVAAAVVPDQLDAALRSGQTAADYLRRLERLVAAARPMAAAPAPRWTLDNLPLPPDVETFGRNLVADLDAYRAGKLAWADVLGRGALLFGPPGTGKTTFAGALAASCGPDVLLVVGGYSIWESGEDAKGSYNGFIKCMRQSFLRAKAAKASILFIDEVDSFMARGSAGHNESWFRPIMNALLAELDGVSGREGVVVIAATNLVDAIDPALRRSGRLDIELHMPLPDAPTLARILAAHLPDLSSANLSGAALGAIGASGADCERWSRGARRRARTAGRPVELDDLLAEVGDAAAGRTDEYCRRVAVHEAGHAVASTVLRPGSVRHVSTRPWCGGIEGGVTTEVFHGVSSTRNLFEGYIVEALAGRAAEEIVLGDVTGGALTDLRDATKIAAMMDVSFGLGAQLLSLGDITPDDVTRILLTRPDVAERVERTLQAAYADALALVRRNRIAVDLLAARLLGEQVLDGRDVSAIVASAA